MRVVTWLQRRWDASVPEDMRDYPWWLAVGTTLGTVAVAIGAIAQRGSQALTWQVLVGGVLALAPSVVEFARSWHMPPLIASAAMLAAVGLLLSQPLPTADLAPFLLVILGAEVTAMSQPITGLIVTTASAVLLIVMSGFVSLPGVGIYIVGVVLGFDVGYTVRWQKRALEAERDRNLVERRQAASAERQRIAREIHDVVAHSLSVTLLHVTGARRALQTDRDIDDAVAALTDAEQVGRQAMTDIRRTVGLLSAERADPAPLPGIADVADLVATVRAAGLQVDYELVGEPDGVSPATELGVYRIVQESLSNVAKHVPKQPATVRLEVMDGRVDLMVCNGLPIGHRTGSGSGLPGMAARAAQFRGRLDAGPDGDTWTVHLRAPAPQEETRHCVVKAVIDDHRRS